MIFKLTTFIITNFKIYYSKYSMNHLLYLKVTKT